MRLSRLMVWAPAGLSALLLLFVLGTTGCGQQPQTPPPKVAKTPGKRTVNCDTTIHVTPAPDHGVDKGAVYVCDDPGFNTLSWVAPPGLTFKVYFASTSSADCPFNPCPASITDGTPQNVAPQTNGLTVYKYTIEVTTGGNIHGFDPHVVGGGGY